ncbi:MAG TPA: VCBS repeat-containing protein [Candidatus Angelobacter sp.]
MAEPATGCRPLGGEDFLIQQNWVDASGGFCGMRFGAPPPPEFLLQTGTPIGAADAAANMTFAAGDFNGDGIPDLFVFKKSNTGSGTLEVHVLDGATNYQTFLLHIATPIGQADAAVNFTFAVGDFNRDGVPDVFAFKHSNTGTGSLEVHVLSGAGNYQTFLLNTGTSISQVAAAIPTKYPATPLCCHLRCVVR